jgi:hypothetical protein
MRRQTTTFHHIAAIPLGDTIPSIGVAEPAEQQLFAQAGAGAKVFLARLWSQSFFGLALFPEPGM